jgi:hypothetical protein
MAKITFAKNAERKQQGDLLNGDTARTSNYEKRGREMSRRGHGEGSIFERKDGRWVAIVDYGYRDGKRHRKSIYGATRKEVSDELKRTLRSQQLGIPPESGRLTVGEWLTKWLETHKPPTTKPKTYAAYEYHTRMHLIPAFGQRPLVKLQPQEVREFMQSKASPYVMASSGAMWQPLLSRPSSRSDRFTCLTKPKPRNFSRS